MCNDYRLRRALERLMAERRQLRLPLGFPDGQPNLEPRDHIRPGDRAPIIRAEAGEAAMEIRPWARPVNGLHFNWRSEGRKFAPARRCLIPADSFAEFTDPEPGGPVGKTGKPLRTRWDFTLPGEELICLAGYLPPRSHVGEFTMLTCAAGPDVQPYHPERPERQVIPVPAEAWGPWLTGEASEVEILRPLPAGSLQVARGT